MQVEDDHRQKVSSIYSCYSGRMGAVVVVREERGQQLVERSVEIERSV